MKNLYCVVFDVLLHNAKNHEPQKHRVTLATVAGDADTAFTTTDETMRKLIAPNYAFEYVQTYQPER